MYVAYDCSKADAPDTRRCRAHLLCALAVRALVAAVHLRELDLGELHPLHLLRLQLHLPSLLLYLHLGELHLLIALRVCERLLELHLEMHLLELHLRAYGRVAARVLLAGSCKGHSWRKQRHRRGKPECPCDYGLLHNSCVLIIGKFPSGILM